MVLISETLTHFILDGPFIHSPDLYVSLGSDNVRSGELISYSLLGLKRLTLEKMSIIKDQRLEKVPLYWTSNILKGKDASSGYQIEYSRGLA